MASDVLVAGALSLDTTEGRSLSALGGVVTYASLTFARLGLSPTAAFRLAPSELWARDRLQNLGVRVVCAASARTTRFVQAVEGEHREQWMPAAAEPIAADWLAAELRPGRHVHLGPLHPRDLGDELFLGPALETCVVSLDLQGLVRACRDGHIVPWVSPQLPAALQCAQFVKASRDEIALVCSAWGMNEQQLVQRFGLEALLITDASKGGRVLGAGQELAFRAAPVSAVADSTGAGDVFFAAWLARRLHAGEPLDAACRHAAEVAAQHVEGRWLPDGALHVPA